MLRVKERSLSYSNDGQTFEVGIVGDVLEDRQSAAARECELNRTNSGELRDTIEIRIKQDSRVADDDDAHVLLIYLVSQSSPRIKCIADVTRDELEPAHLPLPEGGEQDHEDQDDERHSPPGLGGDVALRNRLRDTWSVGCCKPQTGGQRLTAGIDSDLFRTGNR